MTMDYNTRSNLIGELANSFSAPESDLHIDTANYITDTKALDCTAMGLSLDTLQKTQKVIEFQEAKINSKKNTDPEKVQLLAHLKVAKKCVEEVIAQKMKK